MEKKDIIRKLCSRKLWLAVAGFVAGILVFLGYPKETAVKVAALIVSGGSIMAYILAEGWADASHAGQTTIALPWEMIGEGEDETPGETEQHE